MCWFWFALLLFYLFFSIFNIPPPTASYSLSLHDALPISDILLINGEPLKDITLLEHPDVALALIMKDGRIYRNQLARSEEHTSELQSHSDLVCRLLLEKKK